MGVSVQASRGYRPLGRTGQVAGHAVAPSRRDVSSRHLDNLPKPQVQLLNLEIKQISDSRNQGGQAISGTQLQRPVLVTAGPPARPYCYALLRSSYLARNMPLLFQFGECTPC